MRAKMIKQKPIYIIAEAGVNHNGNIKEARRFIREAVLAGADAIKFQTFSVEENYNLKLTSANKLKWARDLELPQNYFKELAKLCREAKIDFLSTPFDLSSAKLLNRLGMKAFKIASSELCNFPLLKYVASQGKPIFLSVGMALAEEIQLAIKTIHHSWPKGKMPVKLCLLHCVSVYPAPYALTNLKKITTIQKQFSVSVGFSDHSLGIEVPIASVALGVSVIEKHFKLSSDARCPDAEISLDPIEFKRMVEAIRHVESSLGSGDMELSSQERLARHSLRKGLSAARPIKKGEVLRQEDIVLRKPAGTIGLEKYFQVLGNRMAIDIQEGQLFTVQHLQKKFKI